MRILLVEDDRSLSRAVSTILQKNNYSVDCVDNGQLALDYLDQDIYDMVIMDIMMPVMDGLEAARQIRTLNRKDTKEIPIIAMTANAFQDDIRDCIDAGMNGHIAKPIDIEKMEAVILSVLEKQESLQNGKNNSING